MTEQAAKELEKMINEAVEKGAAEYSEYVYSKIGNTKKCLFSKSDAENPKNSSGFSASEAT